jgi:MscS family membrane protein
VKIVLDRIVEKLKSHPDIDRDTARARLIYLTPTGPQIEVYAYFRKHGADWAEFLSAQEELILSFMNAIEASGTSLAAPIAMMQPETRFTQTAKLEKQP